MPRFDWATFLSDYGQDDVFVGVCRGVVARIAPDVRVLDVCHLVTPQDVRHGATLLASAVEFMPPAVHLALVDPMRDQPTRGVVVVTGSGSLLVGPDNGLLSLAWDVLGGVREARELTNEDLQLPVRSHTFRGRDVFAPVAAHLALGVPPEQAGPAVEPAGLVRVRQRGATVDDDHVHAEVVNVDHFGNLSLNVRRSDLEAAGMGLGDTVELRCTGRVLHVPFTVSGGEVAAGRVAVCEDSFRAVMVAVNGGHAARTLRIGRGDPMVISRIPRPARD